MKTKSIIKGISRLILFAFLLLISFELRSQYVITFKDMTRDTVFITYQTNDTLKYFLKSQPKVVYVVLMDDIQRISPVEQIEAFQDESIDSLTCIKKYKHYLHMTIGGPILFSSGCVLTGLGIAGLVSLSDEHDDELTKVGRAFCGVATAVGIVGVITGIATTVSGAINMQKYKEKMRGFSFDLKCTPRQTGISLVYRF